MVGALRAAELGQIFYQNMIGLAAQAIPKVLGAVVVLLITRLAMNIAGRFTHRTLKYAEPTLQRFLVQAAQTLTLVIGIIVLLDTVGIESTTLVAVVGAAGLAIGLALQNTLSHFAAGVMLILFRPFEVGDLIEGAGVAGVVDSIGLFSTILLTPDNVKIVVPNSVLFSGILKNTTRMGTRRVDLQVDIGNRRIDPTICRLLELAQSHPLVLKQPQPTCHVMSISATGTVLYLRPWCLTQHYDQVHAEVQQKIKETLDSTQT